MEAGGARVQSHSLLHREFQASLGYMGVLSLKTNQIYSSDRSFLEIFLIKGKQHPDQVVDLTVQSITKKAMVPRRSITRLQSEALGQHTHPCPLSKELRWSVYAHIVLKIELEQM